MKKIIAFGTFDHFHAGHESYLEQAKSFGEHLTVIIALDETVERLKARKPDYTAQQRRDAVIKSGIADRVVLGKSGDKYDVLRKYKPDVIALGYDQFAFTVRLKKFLIDENMNTKIIRLEPYKPEVHKTSIIRLNKLATQ